MTDMVNLLARPVYGMSEVDYVLQIPPGTARRWIDGYRRGGRLYPPVVRLENTGSDLVTWGEFVETRLLAEYRDRGVPMVHLRPTVERLREEFNVAHPLAYARTWLEPDGNELVARIQDDTELDAPLRFVVYRNGQLTLASPAQRFVDSAVFDGIVTQFRPDADLQVFIDPERQFGKPVVRSVPTDVLAEQYEAGDHPEMIASLYELDLGLVHDAIRYELKRRSTSARAA